MPLIPIKNIEVSDFFKNELPINPARAGWKIDHEVFDRITKELGIELDIKVRYSGGRYTYGTHYIKHNAFRRKTIPSPIPVGYYHQIVLLQNRPIDEANETLWHELRHAMQAEAYAKKNPHKTVAHFYRDEYLDGRPYIHKVYEVDARDFAAQNKHVNLLKLS